MMTIKGWFDDKKGVTNCKKTVIIYLYLSKNLNNINFFDDFYV